MFSAKFQEYIQLTRLNRPIGILLLLWPTLWGLWIAAAGTPDITILIIFIIGTVLMRSAGCAINDYADRDFDKHVERTKNRPLTAGRISTSEALLVASNLTFLAFLLILPLNNLTRWLAVPALFLAASYPFTKRFFSLPQAYLGLAFGFGIPMAFAAVTNHVSAIAWLLVLANVFWCMAYDTEYAMVDRNDDLHIGIKSSAILFGKYDVLAIMMLYAACLLALSVSGMLLHYHWPFYIGLLFAGAISVYHYTLIKDRQRDKCFRAFLHNNWFGLSIFIGITVELFLFKPV